MLGLLSDKTARHKQSRAAILATKCQDEAPSVYHSTILRVVPHLHCPRWLLDGGEGGEEEEERHAPSSQQGGLIISYGLSSDTSLARALSCDHTELQGRLGNVVLRMYISQSQNL